jgi:hypothetical protein
LRAWLLGARLLRAGLLAIRLVTIRLRIILRLRSFILRFTLSAIGSIVGFFRGAST